MRKGVCWIHLAVWSRQTKKLRQWGLKQNQVSWTPSPGRCCRNTYWSLWCHTWPHVNACRRHLPARLGTHVCSILFCGSVLCASFCCPSIRRCSGYFLFENLCLSFLGTLLVWACLYTHRSMNIMLLMLHLTKQIEWDFQVWNNFNTLLKGQSTVVVDV